MPFDQIVSPEWLSDLCKTLDGDTTSITDDQVKSNAIVQNIGNPHYKDIYLTSLGETDDI